MKKLKAIGLGAMVTLLTYVVGMILINSNTAQASTTQIPEGEKRIILQYQTTINGVKYQILEIDGWDYVAQENGCITRLKS